MNHNKMMRKIYDEISVTTEIKPTGRTNREYLEWIQKGVYRGCPVNIYFVTTPRDFITAQKYGWHKIAFENNLMKVYVDSATC